MIVAITGNIGSGKSTAADIFSRFGYKIINADKVGHELYRKKHIKDKVISKFGKDILANGRIDRKKLKEIVFYDPKQLKALNRIMHPAILKQISSLIAENKTKNIVVEGALIVEAKYKKYDKLILVTINRQQQLKRLLKKGKYNKQEINNIIESQLSQAKKRKYADYIIDNSGSRDHLDHAVKKIIEELK